MDVVRHAADARTFASSIASHRGEIGVQRRTNGWDQARQAVLRAEDEMNQDVGERLRHGMDRAFSPRTLWDRQPGALPQAGMGSRRWR